MSNLKKVAKEKAKQNISHPMYKSWKEIWDDGGTKDDWKTTLKKMSQYKDFIEAAEAMLGEGRTLTITTGGGSLNHKLGALDIGRSNFKSQEEFEAIGQLALEYGYRVGDEAHHLHIDNTINVQTDKARKDVEDWYKKNPPKNPEDLPKLIEKGTEMAIASRKKLDEEDDNFIPSSQIFYEPRSSAKSEDIQATNKRKEDRFFEKRAEELEKGKASQEEWNREAMQPSSQQEFNRKALMEQDSRQSPLDNFRSINRVKPEEEKEIETIQKMSIARKADFGLYS